jgi:hypothetical protein
MIKKATVGHIHVILSSAKENPYKRERMVTRVKFLNSTPHRLRMTIGFRALMKHPTHRTAFRQAMMAA